MSFFFKLHHYFLQRAFPCSICLLNTTHLVNPFSSLAFLLKNSLVCRHCSGVLQPLWWETVQLLWVMDWLSAGRAGLSWEPVEHIVMATSQWVCLDYAVQWGNACDVTSRKQTGERGIHTIGGNSGIGTNVCQTTAHSVMKGTVTEEERQTRPVTELLQESLYFDLFFQSSESHSGDCNKKIALVTVCWSHSKPSPVSLCCL